MIHDFLAKIGLNFIVQPRFTEDGFEEQLQINHLSHFLLVSLLINDVKKSKDPRIVIVGSITGNDNTVGKLQILITYALF